jgi:hypothetical protein
MHHPQAVLCDVALLLFLLFAANYQPPISYSRQKSWAVDGLRSGEQRESSPFFRSFPLFVTPEALRKPGPREIARWLDTVLARVRQRAKLAGLH